MNRIKLNDSLRSLVFRKVIHLLRENPILRRTFRPSSWYTWDGNPNMKDDPFTQGALPAIRITPVAQPSRPLTNIRFESPFLLKFEIGTEGLDVTDTINLWDYIHFTIFTGDGGKATLTALQSLSVGLNPPGQAVISITLGTPAFTPVVSTTGAEAIVSDGDLWINMMMPR